MDKTKPTTSAITKSQTNSPLGSKRCVRSPDLQTIDLDGFNFIVRKSAHILQFFVFALLLWRAARINPPLRIDDRRLLALILAVSLLVGGLSEAFQIFSPVRGASLNDVLLDFTGAILGVFVLALTGSSREQSMQQVA